MKNQSQATPCKSLGSAFRTGILVAAAFFAGLGVANISAINGLAPAQLPIPMESEEAQPETTATIHHSQDNRPPSNEIRDWYVTKEVETSIVKEHYHIHEIAFLVGREYREKATNKIEQKDTIYNYRYYPQAQEFYLANGELGYSKHINGFSQDYFAPESAQIKTLLNDGSYDIVDVEYLINAKAKLRNIKPEQPAKQKSNTDEMTNALFDAFFGSDE